jgi:Ser/Thr protein kinase RdoA (MazF antagonist)
MSDVLDLDEINKNIADRSNVFYWQAERSIEPKDAALVWADRHRYFSDEELLKRVNEVLDKEKLVSIIPFDPKSQTNLGNINSVRIGTLESGKEIIIRCHPKGVMNGYFHVESLAADKANEAGLPSFETIAINDFTGGDDFAFQVIEKLPGATVQTWLEEHPEDEAALLPQIGKMMARLHKIPVDGFGPFNNERAKNGELVGLHQNLAGAMQAGLDFDLSVLTKESIVSPEQATSISKMFTDENPLLALEKGVLVHNDFADWNLLTDGKDVSGVIDWDECVGSDPIADVACWSTFFPPERLGVFLEGYWQVAKKPDDFTQKFELFRLRYTLSKMTLRIRKYTWDPSETVKNKIEYGKQHLAKSFKYFGI